MRRIIESQSISFSAGHEEERYIFLPIASNQSMVLTALADARLASQL
jgi:hypothetical protein